MLKRILFILFIAITIGASVYAYFYLKSIKEPKVNVTALLPADCSLLIECDDYAKFSKKLITNSLIWEELKQDSLFSSFNTNLNILDSALAADKNLNDLLEENRIYMATYINNGSYDHIIAFSLKSADQINSLLSFIKSNNVHIEKISSANGNKEVNKLTLKNKSVFYLQENSNVILLSQNPKLLDRINDPATVRLADDKHFLKLEEDGGNNMDLRLYMRNSFYSKLLNPQSISNFPVKAHNEWTTLDLNSTENELILNGFIDKDSSIFLKALCSQEPVEYTFTEVTPKNTFEFVYLGLSNYQNFHDQLISSLSDTLLQTEKFYSNRTDAGLANEWNSVFTGQFAAIEALIENKNESFALASIDEDEKGRSFLKQICTIDSSGSGNDSIYHFQSSLVVPLLTLNIIQKEYTSATIFKGFILFAKSDSLCKKYINEINSAGTLAKSDRFTATGLTNLNKECNFYYYNDISFNTSGFSSLINNDITNKITSLNDRLSKFGFFGTQLSAHKNKILSQTCLHYNPITKSQSLTLWETQLDTTSHCIPQILINHKTNGKELFAYDDAGNIYLISNTGKILWKKALKEKVIGSVHQIDFFQNGKLQMLFNTSTKIHLIDRNGNYVTGYPIELDAPASNALSVFDYENNKDYRILIACTNKKIYNYNINGKQVEGFNFPTTEDTVKLPVEFKRINAKDYLLVIDKSGKIYGTSRKGESRISFKNKLPSQNQSYFLFEGKDLSKSKYYAFDFKENQTIQLSLDDKINTYSFESDLKLKSLSYDFVNEDKIVDYILSDESGFEIIDDQGKKLMNFVSKKDLQPGCKGITYNDQFYILLLDTDNKLVMVDASSNEMEIPDQYFSNLPVLSKINNDESSFLIGSFKDKINCYTFRQ